MDCMAWKASEGWRTHLDENDANSSTNNTVHRSYHRIFFFSISAFIRSGHNCFVRPSLARLFSLQPVPITHCSYSWFNLSITHNPSLPILLLCRDFLSSCMPVRIECCRSNRARIKGRRKKHYLVQRNILQNHERARQLSGSTSSLPGCPRHCRRWISGVCRAAWTDYALSETARRMSCHCSIFGGGSTEKSLISSACISCARLHWSCWLGCLPLGLTKRCLGPQLDPSRRHGLG